MSEPADPASYTVDGGARPLSGEALSALLQDVLARHVPFRFEARGYSMLPFIRTGDIVTVAPLDGRARVGDVVAFAGPAQELVVHRVVARHPATYEISPDNTGALHDPAKPDVVPFRAVLGVVTKVERDGRRVHLGLGPERLLIVALVRFGWLQPLVAALRALRLHVAGSGAL